MKHDDDVCMLLFWTLWPCLESPYDGVVCCGLLAARTLPNTLLLFALFGLDDNECIHPAAVKHYPAPEKSHVWCCLVVLKILHDDDVLWPWLLVDCCVHVLLILMMNLDDDHLLQFRKPCPELFLLFVCVVVHVTNSIVTTLMFAWWLHDVVVVCWSSFGVDVGNIMRLHAGRTLGF